MTRRYPLSLKSTHFYPDRRGFERFNHTFYVLQILIGIDDYTRTFMGQDVSVSVSSFILLLLVSTGGGCYKVTYKWV